MKYIVRLYDGFDNIWIDICSPITKEKAEKLWNKNTEEGTRHTSYIDIDYYKIFPADTIMVNKE